MSDQPRVAESWFDWAVAVAPFENGESGDVHVVVRRAHGVLVGVIDGLGHGGHAAHAAQEAARILQAHAEASLLELVAHCHEGLRKTRGAVMTLATLDAAGNLEWVGVGNVEGVVLSPESDARTSAALILRGGVVGYRLPPLRVSTHALGPGDLLVFATDGVRTGFVDGIDRELPAQALADSILTRFIKGTDDALVLTLRFIGAAPWPS